MSRIATRSLETAGHRPASRHIREWATAAPFVALPIIGLVVFVGYPVVASLGFSLTRWNLLGPPEFVGLDNYAKLAGSPMFLQVLGNTVTYLVLYVPLAVALPLLLAVALNQHLRFRSLYRAVFFLPVVTSTVAIALIWSFIYNPDYGPLNQALAAIGVDGPRWLADPAWAMPAIVIMSVWKVAGYNMVIYLAGLQAIPSEYYEVASLDGASALQRLRYLTVPLVSPTMFFVLIISIISSFQVFESTYMLTQGGPLNSTTTLGLWVYQQAFRYSNMGYASAIAWVLFLLTLAFTLMQLRLQRRWVNYE